MFYYFHMATYNIKTLKEKIEIMKFLDHHTWKETMQKYDLPRATLVHWRKLMAAGGKNGKHPLERKDKRHTIREETVAVVKKIHKEHPTWSLSQIKKKASKTQSISRTTIWHILTGR